MRTPSRFLPELMDCEGVRRHCEEPRRSLGEGGRRSNPRAKGEILFVTPGLLRPATRIRARGPRNDAYILFYMDFNP
jgi:hypothetical protein